MSVSSSEEQVANQEETATENRPKRIISIQAHPDDAEFACAGTIAKWAAEGHEIAFVLITSGDKGSSDPAISTEQLIKIREAEQRAACAILGVKDVVFLRYEDAMLVPDLKLRRDITRVIRQLKPDVVITGDPTVRWAGGGYLNHPDHRAAAEATLDAIYPAARDRMTFPELIAEGLEPHKVTELYLAWAKDPNTFIDITDYIDRKVASLRAHASQMRDWNPEEPVREWAAETAKQLDPPGQYAESFHYFKLE